MDAEPGHSIGGGRGLKKREETRIGMGQFTSFKAERHAGLKHQPSHCFFITTKLCSLFITTTIVVYYCRPITKLFACAVDLLLHFLFDTAVPVTKLFEFVVASQSIRALVVGIKPLVLVGSLKAAFFPQLFPNFFSRKNGKVYFCNIRPWRRLLLVARRLLLLRMPSTGATMRTRCSLRPLLPPVRLLFSGTRSSWRTRWGVHIRFGGGPEQLLIFPLKGFLFKIKH